MSNQGENDELIVQLKLIELRDAKISVENFGLINSIKFNNEYFYRYLYCFIKK